MNNLANQDIKTSPIWGLFQKIATRIIRKTQCILGMVTLGSRAIIINPQNQVLLVKHTYEPHWYIPGGGIKKGESAKACILRELKEEVGLTTTTEPQLFGIYFHTYLGVDDYPIIYVITEYSIIDAHSAEIEQIGWFDMDNLPEMISPGTKRRLCEYFFKQPQSETW